VELERSEKRPRLILSQVNAAPRRPSRGGRETPPRQKTQWISIRPAPTLRIQTRTAREAGASIDRGDTRCEAPPLVVEPIITRKGISESSEQRRDGA